MGRILLKAAIEVSKQEGKGNNSCKEKVPRTAVMLPVFGGQERGEPPLPKDSASPA